MKQTRKCGTIMKQPEFRVIVAGSRGITDYAFIRDRLDRILSGKALTHAITIISGCARGVDTLGERYAHERGYAILQFPADWDRYGRSAGYRRNVEMAHHAHALAAFWDGSSRGTGHMIEIARDNDLPVRIFQP